MMWKLAAPRELEIAPPRKHDASPTRNSPAATRDYTI